MEFKEWTEMHGRAGSKNWAQPTLVAKSNQPNRQDQGNTILANEYLDDPQVLDEKMEKIAALILKSKCIIAYTGAGLSKASGIPDYASKAENSIVKTTKLKSSLDAFPTYSHYILKRMYDAGRLQYWVQQNHDGLPQKAGFPQHKINEIHGAWFDPSNPVVQFSGKLRSDLFNEMIEYESKADLCLCLGTSLSGMNADRMAKTPAKKFINNQNNSQGTIIINLQKTSLDKNTSIRVWAKLDDAFKILAQKLGIDHSNPPSALVYPSFADQMIFEVPYDKSGKYNPQVKMTWDLRIGQPIIISSPGASNEGCIGNIYRRSNTDKNWSVSIQEDKKNNRLSYYAFGWWWIEAACKGLIPHLPLININPVVVNVDNLIDDNNNIINSNNNINNNNNNNQESNYYAVAVGNLHSVVDVDGNNHKWTVYVKSLRDQEKLQAGLDFNSVIDHVEFKLHSSFSPSTVTVSKFPFEVTRYGWGTFNIKIKVTYTDNVCKTYTHQLSFDHDDNQIIFDNF